MNPEDRELIQRDYDELNRWVDEVEEYALFCNSHGDDLATILYHIDDCLENVAFARRLKNLYDTGDISDLQVINALNGQMGGLVTSPDWITPTIQPNHDVVVFRENPSSLMQYNVRIILALDELLAEGVVSGQYKDNLVAANAPEYVTRYFDSPVVREVPDDVIEFADKLGYEVVERVE